MTKKKRMSTEEANIKLNNAFYREENHEDSDIDQLINNNHISLVLYDSKDNDKDNEDM